VILYCQYECNNKPVCSGDSLIRNNMTQNMNSSRTKIKTDIDKQIKAESKVVRTSTMRLILTPEQEIELNKLNDEHQSVGRNIQKEVYSSSGKVYDHKRTGIVVDGTNVSPDEKDVYEVFTGMADSKCLANSLLAEEFKSKEKIIEDIEKKQIEYDELNSVNIERFSKDRLKDHKKLLLKAKNKLEYSQGILKLVNLREQGILPINVGENEKLHLLNYYQYDTMKGVKARFDSWNECNKATGQTYTEINDELIKVKSKLMESFNEETLNELSSLLSAIKELNEQYTDISFLNYKFISFFKNYWRPNALTNGTGLLEGEWTTKDGDKVSYSFHPEVNKLLLSKPLLWKDDNCILLHPLLDDYCDLFDKINRYRKQSSLTLISPDSPIPVGFSSDGNAAPLKNIQHDKNNHQLSITIELPNGEERTYTANYKRKSETKCYYNNLEIRSPRSLEVIEKLAKSEKRKLTYKELVEASLKNCYIFEYSRYGKVKVFATVNTFYIQKRNGQFYLVLPTSIFTNFHNEVKRLNKQAITYTHNDNDGNNQFAANELFKLRTLFQSSKQEIRNLTRTKNIDKIDKMIADIIGDRTLVYGGLDLGYNNPYSMSFFDITTNNGKLVVEERKEEDIVSTIHNEEYRQFTYNCRTTIYLLGITRTTLQTRSVNINIDIIKEPRYGIAKLMELLPENERMIMAQFNSELKNYKSQNLMVKDIKGNRNWIISKLMRILVNQFHNIRGKHSKNWLEIPSLIGSVDAYYSLQKSFNDSGDGIRMLPRNHVYQPGEKRRLDKREENFCKTILEYRDNLKDYFIKKLFSNASHYCHKLGVHIMAMEDLKFEASKKSSKQKNKMYNIWPAGQLQKFAEDSFGYFNILVQYVDKDGTSQHYYKNGVRGYRDGEWLYLPNGYKIHADKNASRMVALRGITHHANIYKRNLTNIGDGYLVNSYELTTETDKENKHQSPAARQREAETRLNGYSATVYHQTENGGVMVDKSLKADSILNGRNITTNKDNTQKYYKIDETNTLYPYTKLVEYENRLKSEHGITD